MPRYEKTELKAVHVNYLASGTVIEVSITIKDTSIYETFKLPIGTPLEKDDILEAIKDYYQDDKLKIHMTNNIRKFING